MIRVTVCKDCEDREVGCHSVCPKYIKQTEARTKEREKIQAIRKRENDLYERTKEAKGRMIKKRR